MSEIKGQLLGILLVIAIFGVVSAALISIFNNLVDTVASEVDEIQTSIIAIKTDLLTYY